MRVLKTIACVLGFAGCAGHDNQSQMPDSAARRAAIAGGDRTSQQAAQAPALESSELTVVPGGTFGPYIGRSGANAVLVWATRNEQGQARWHRLHASAQGQVSGPVQELGPAPNELSLVVIRRAASSEGSGFVVVAGEPTAEGSKVHVLLLGEQGQLQGNPLEVARTTGPVLWLDALPTPGGPLVFWAVTVRGLAELYAARLDDLRQVHKLAGDALAWQLAPSASGAALAIVSQNGVKRDVSVRFTNELGQPEGKPLLLRTRSQAQLDLDLTNVDGNLVVAWSEPSHLEPTLFAASIDAAGKISQPAKRLTAPMGEQALVRLVAPAPAQKRAYVLWENLNQARGKRRLLQVAPLLSNATLGDSRATLEMHGEAATLPEFVATADGLLALSQAPLCLKPPEPCVDGPLLPTFVAFDQQLNVVASEPLRLTQTQGRGIDLAWGLGCGPQGCSVLAAPRSGPAPIYWVKLDKVSNVFAPAASHKDDSQRPRLAANEALQEVDALADLAAVNSDGAELVTWITHFDPTLPYEQLKAPAPDGRYAPVRALLQTLHTKQLANQPFSISLRARSLGGVAIAEGANKDFLLGWAAIDRQVPHVFLTLVNPQGAKKQLHLLTKTPGEKSDVALARLEDGWVVSWVDERHQDPEVYAVKVGNNLLPTTPERRVTEMKGSAADLSLLKLGDQLLFVWGDTRDSEQRGFANVFTKLVNASDLSPIGPEMAISKDLTHAHSIQASPFGNGALVAWLDNGSDGNDGNSPRVRLLVLDAQGKPQGDTYDVQVQASSLSGLALDCGEGEGRCNLVFGGSTQEQAMLWAASFSQDQKPVATLLTTLSGLPTQQLMPTLAGNVVFLNEQSSEGQTRLRRLHVHWE